MELAAFHREHRGPRQFDLWRRRDAMSSVIGDVGLEAMVDVDARPDVEMFRALDEMVALVATRGSELRAMIYSHYCAFCCSDGDWVVECGVPLGLTEEAIAQYVRFASACVSRLGGAAIDRYIHIRPQWDEEHDIFIALAGDSLVILDA